MILKNGSKGKEVKELQRFLDIQADGIFGPGTERHVKKWQAENNLVVDGIKVVLMDIGVVGGVQVS